MTTITKQAAIEAIEAQKASFASNEYAVGQPLSSFAERFACDQIAAAINALPAADEWQKGYEAGVEAAVNALEADARLCDCAALEERECACGSWDDYKSITSARAVEIVRALQEKK